MLPLLWLSIAFVLGAVAAANLPLTALAWGLLGVAALPLGMLFNRWRRNHPQAPAYLGLVFPAIAALALGGIRYRLALPEINPQFIGWYNDTLLDYHIEGIVAAVPDVRDTHTLLRIDVEQLRPQNDLRFRPVNGLLLARLPNDAHSWAYGQRIRLQTRLETPPEAEDFSYRDYLIRQGIYSYARSPADVQPLGEGAINPLLRALYAFKARALQTVYRLWPDPEASLLAGILLGVETGIPAPVADAFRATGTSHVIAISGFNITLVAGFLISIFGRLFGRDWGSLLTALGIVLYTLLVGADAAVLRAAIMGCLALLARQSGRSQDALNTLGVTAAIMTMLNPYTPWDIGFQLSFGATLGLILYAQPMTDAFERFVSAHWGKTAAERITPPVADLVLLTFAAQLTTLPVTMYHFQRISLSALLVNPLILPAQPPVMTLGALALAAGMLFEPLGKLLAPLVWAFIVYTIRIVEIFAEWRGGVLVLGDTALPVVILLYGVLLTGPWWISRFQKARAALGHTIPLVSLMIFSVFVWRLALSAPDGKLHLTLLNVGSGDALLLRTPGGRTVLIDGGPKASLLSNALGRRLPPFARRVDYWVIAAAEPPQIGALPQVLDRFPPDAVLWAGSPQGTREARALQLALAQREIPVTQAQSGHALDLGDGARLQVLHSSARGAVLLLTYGNFRALLPIGVDRDGLQALQDDPNLREVTAVLLAGSGYAPLNPPELLARLHPQVFLLSVAADDYNGLPSPQTLAALQGYNLLRTDRNGWVELITDGENLWVQAERP